ncbi:MAG: peptidyl-tRNA hydrolase [Nitrososphaerota archaeon]|nr:peptidyl-tRNA hydrolase [Nitrososphaerota archaeon]MDG6939377.1 peptidyl-tRNA hydrolase [Nitrososphaerota archaeon]
MERDFRYKQVLVVRGDVKMGKGKTAAQAAHAAVASAMEARRARPEWFESWTREGQAKIVVRGGTEREMYELKERAEELGLPTAVIVDRGLTQVEPNTLTCLGVGPGPADVVDRVTGGLRLL